MRILVIASNDRWVAVLRQKDNSFRCAHGLLIAAKSFVVSFDKNKVRGCGPSDLSFGTVRGSDFRCQG